MLKKLRNYINDESWKINIFNNSINIINYIDILFMGENKISIKYDNGIITINGEGLSVNKMLEQEMLITGIIKNIEFK